jgi:hypothetical protein
MTATYVYTNHERHDRWFSFFLLLLRHLHLAREDNIMEVTCKIIPFHPCYTPALGHILWLCHTKLVIEPARQGHLCQLHHLHHEATLLLYLCMFRIFVTAAMKLWSNPQILKVHQQSVWL